MTRYVTILFVICAMLAMAGMAQAQTGTRPFRLPSERKPL